MSSRVRRPETELLKISRGDWLLVKKHLTAGEYREMLNRYTVLNGGSYSIDPLKVEQSKMIAYLLDWNITDADDKPMVIRDQPPDVVSAALDALPYEDWQEIKEAIAKHDYAMDKLREAEKNARDGEHNSSAISPSVAFLAGPSNTLEHYHDTSTTLSLKS